MEHPSFGRTIEPAGGADFLEPGVFAILRAPGTSRLRPVLRTLFDAGIRTVELTMTTPGALDGMAVALEEAPPGAWVGMGTVLDREAAREAIRAGAGFVVSAVLDEGMIEACVEAGIPAIPGASTPTEMLRAWRLGATAVKVFPASVLGPGFIRQVLAPLPQLRLVATGGIGVEDAGEFLRAGAVAVGLGTPLLGDALSGGDLEALAGRCRRVLETVAEARAAT